VNIDPTVTRPRGRLVAPVDSLLVDLFSACHLLAFSTAYTITDYYLEGKRRLEDGETFDYRGSPNAASQMTHMMTLLRDGEMERFVSNYVDALGHSRRFLDAARIIQDAAVRGEIEVVAFRVGVDEPVILAPLHFYNRPPFRPTTGRMFKRGGDETVEWEGLTFRRDQILNLQTASWHQLERLRGAANDDSDFRQPLAEESKSHDAIRKSGRREAEKHFKAIVEASPGTVPFEWRKTRAIERLASEFKISDGVAATVRSTVLDESPPEVQAVWKRAGAPKSNRPR
jgi:hypothetical protein